MKNKALSALVPEEGHKRVEDFAWKKRMSLANLIREAVVFYMASEGESISFEELSPGEWGGNRRYTEGESVDPELIAGAA